MKSSGQRAVAYGYEYGDDCKDHGFGYDDCLKYGNDDYGNNPIEKEEGWMDPGAWGYDAQPYELRTHCHDLVLNRNLFEEEYRAAGKRQHGEEPQKRGAPSAPLGAGPEPEDPTGREDPALA